jgi:uncharacterized membrane-anchored protein YhcB (DUF1043 family)
MTEWQLIGIGIVIGIGIGTYFTSLIAKQKPWSGLSEQEKKIRIGLTVTGGILFILGIVTFFLYNK